MSDYKEFRFTGKADTICDCCKHELVTLFIGMEAKHDLEGDADWCLCRGCFDAKNKQTPNFWLHGVLNRAVKKRGRDDADDFAEKRRRR